MSADSIGWVGGDCYSISADSIGWVGGDCYSISAGLVETATPSVPTT